VNRWLPAVWVLALLLLSSSPGRSQTTDNRGTEFWLLFQENADDSVNLSLFITSEFNANGTVEIPGLNFTTPFQVSQGTITRVGLPNTAMIQGSGTVSNLGIHVVSNFEVSVYGLNQRTFSTDAFLGLPVDVLDVDYLVLAYSVSSLNPFASSQFAIVSPYDNVQVSIGLVNQTPFFITLNRGQTYQYQSTISDVTGTIIQSSAPVAVFAGHVCGNVPADVPFCDHLVEQIPPVSTWGSRILTAPLATRLKGDTFRMLSASNGTAVFLNGEQVSTLDRGQFYEQIIEGGSEITTNDTTKTLLVAQYSNGTEYDSVTSDPFMMIIPPVNQYQNGYVLTTPDAGFTGNYLNVVAQTGNISTLRLDDLPLSQSAFQPIANTPFSFANVPINLGPHGIVSTSGAPFGVYIYGFGEFDSYGYAGGLALGGVFAAVPTTPPGLRSGIILRVTPPSGFLATGGNLFYRPGGSALYQVTPLQAAGSAFEGSIPDSLATLRGIEYYVELTDGIFTRSLPAVNPAANPSVLNITFSRFDAPVGLNPVTYRMVSVPAELQDPRPSAVFEDDLGPYNPARWRLFRWQQDAYVENPEIPVTLTPGNAFWLITDTRSGFDVDNGQSVSTSRPIVVTLEPGWNQIGNPFSFPVRWSDVLVPGGPSTIRGPYFFDGSEYTPATDVLLPWEGYFVRNDSSVSIALSIPPIDTTILGKVAFTASEDYTLRVQAEISGTEYRDTWNIVGFRPDAEVGYDRYDEPEPPPVTDRFRFSIVEGGEQFMKNIKPFGQAGQRWDFLLTSSGLTGTVLMTFKEQGTLPEQFGLYVLDQDLGSSVQLTDRTFRVSLNGGNQVRRFRVIIGTPEYAESQRNGIPLEPIAFALHQNFPNPFNPQTSIGYDIEHVSRVTLTIFDLLGKKVRTLVNSEQPAGRYHVTWDGTNDQGARLSSGIYLYQLRAGAFIHSRKLMLLR